MNRDDFLAAIEGAVEKPTPLDVPKLGRVYIKSLTVAEVDAIAIRTAEPGFVYTNAYGVAQILCDADGERVLDATKPEDVATLARLPWATLKFILEANAENVGVDAAKND